MLCALGSHFLTHSSARSSERGFIRSKPYFFGDAIDQTEFVLTCALGQESDHADVDVEDAGTAPMM